MTVQNISDTAKYLFIQVYEYQNGVNLFGILPLKSESKQYKKAKKTIMCYAENRKLTTLYNYIKENL